MSHGFSRFGPPPARERLHRQMRGPGTLSMLLPTIFATLFLFVVVVTLNKATSMTRGGKIVRLMNVDDVFQTPAAVEQNRKKEFWELTVPPPSPESVLIHVDYNIPVLVEPPPSPVQLPDTSFRPHSAPRVTDIPTPEIQLPTVTPDTALPVATPTP